VSVPRHVTRLATHAFLGGLSAIDLLAQPSVAAHVSAQAGLSEREHLEAIGWIARHYTLQHHALVRCGRVSDTGAKPNTALAVVDVTTGLLE